MLVILAIGLTVTPASCSIVPVSIPRPKGQVMATVFVPAANGGEGATVTLAECDGCGRLIAANLMDAHKATPSGKSQSIASCD